MKTLGVIPARFGSSRFPGKPLALILGKPMIQRVFFQARKASSLSDVVVATDDARIFDLVQDFGGRVLMTRDDHASGTDRCAEILEQAGEGFDLVVNIQGDEPFIHPQQIDLLVQTMEATGAGIGTLVKTIRESADLQNENIPKVVCDHLGHALYFSRRPIPFASPSDAGSWLTNGVFLKHIGIYAYQASLLPKLAQLKRSTLEMCESLEQLRWLEAGYRIMTARTAHENFAVDVPSDIMLVENHFRHSADL